MTETHSKIVVLISADAEWRAVKERFPHHSYKPSPFGEWFTTTKVVRSGSQMQERPVIFFHGGFGKICAAASTQFAIDHWSPDLLINLGTCGGFESHIRRGVIILVERTVVYDIFEQMGAPERIINEYITDIDLSWLDVPYPQEVLRTTLVSGDRDLLADDIPHLRLKYGAVAGDWESGAIAYIARRNNLRVLILRGVTDLVSPLGGEAYGNIQFFEMETVKIMGSLLDALPDWIKACGLNP